MPQNKQVSRRHFLYGVGALATLPLAAAYSQTPLAGEVTAENAYIWGFPLVLTSRYRGLASSYPVNQFTLSDRLSEPHDRVAAPNVDTLYGFAFLDVSREPVLLHVPATGERYYSIHLIDAYQNSFAYVGRRTTGTQESEYAITAPGWKGNLPAGVTRIESPTGHLLALARTLVYNEADLPAARAIQAQYTLRPLKAAEASGTAPRVAAAAFNVFPYINLFDSGAKFFDELNSALTIDPPSSHEKRWKDFTHIGIGPRQNAPLSLDADSLEDAALSAHRKIRDANYSTDSNGWRVNYRVTNFISDPLLRASINRIGPGTHVAEEALYFTATTDHNGQSLNGQTRYRIRFAAGALPPVNAFWSLILYGQDYSLFENPLRRYAITDRTEGLVTGADGSLELTLQADKPDSNIANWLPTPPSTTFSLVLRAYQPRAEALNGSYKLPPIERV